MSILKGKKILLAISGSIAAYKTPILVRQLVKQGAIVKVLMTEAAATLVSPLSLSTVSKHEVIRDISNEDTWNNHVDLGYWADALLFAPISANTLAHLACGLCNNSLHAVYLSAKCPVLFAPAMDMDMWNHPAVVSNVQELIARGHHYIPVGEGELASGLIGAGRMAEPEVIVDHLAAFFQLQAIPIKDKPKAVVTAGPTYERLDPVRFIGNFSSGKMGLALAEALVEKGFFVHLIVGPNVQTTENENISVHRIESAREMKAEAETYFPQAKIAVMAAAVADFRPATQAEEKIKKGKADAMQVALVKNPDILAYLGSIKTESQIVVGFALETQNAIENALGKLQRKNADYIALNSLKDEGVGFGKDTNKVTLIGKDGSQVELPLASKKEIAKQMMDAILQKH